MIHVNKEAFKDQPMGYFQQFETYACAQDESGAVAVGVVCGKLYPIRYAPAALGKAENYAQYETLFTRAATKLGWKRDKRCKGGWRKIKQVPV